MELKIEKNIPVQRGYIRDDGIIGVFRKMEVGDSILFQKRFTPAYSYAKMAGIRISQRRTEDGFRIWRVE